MIILSALLVVIVVASLLFSMKPRTMTEKSVFQLASIDSIPDSDWEKLAGMRIFFGHQSVGDNVVDGMRNVFEEHPQTKLNLVDTTDLASIESSAFLHSKVGVNARPETKVESFARIVESGGGAELDFAFLKFCYVDINRDSDPEAIFQLYQSAIADLSERFPDTTFVHVTVPVESAPVGAKGILKETIKAILRRPGVVEDNSVRQRYNELLRSSYSDHEPIFDIARYETIGPEGRASYRNLGSEKVFLMDSQYTNDGGHLNSTGRRMVAEQLLATMVEAAGGKEHPSTPQVD